MDSNSVKKRLIPNAEGLTTCGLKAKIMKNDLRDTFDILAVIEILPFEWQKHAKTRDVPFVFSSSSANDHFGYLVSNTNSEKTMKLDLHSFS
jgi:hypothetical protein